MVGVIHHTINYNDASMEVKRDIGGRTGFWKAAWFLLELEGADEP